MPDNWKRLSRPERAELVLQNVEGLSDADRQAIYNQWSLRTYADNLFGYTEAEADLQAIAVEHLLKKTGKWGAELKRRERNLTQKVGK